MLLADADPLSGWVQCILQTGALGLLAVIIYYGPAWIERLLASQQTEREKLLQAFREETREDRAEFSHRTARVVQSIERQTHKITDKLDKQTQALGDKLEVVHNDLSGVCKADEYRDPGAAGAKGGTLPGPVRPPDKPRQ